jgi:ribose-phosphate pyrophosphokinase
VIKLLSMTNTEGHLTFPAGKEIKFNSFVFSGGEIQVQVGPKDCPHCSLPRVVKIVADVFSAIDFMTLIHTVDALRRRGTEEIHLVCKYLPYARQDRVMENGESLGIKVATDLINSLNFKSVEVWDVHSDTSLALINNVHHVDQGSFARFAWPAFEPGVVLVAPDGGALKKVFKTAKGYDRDMVVAEKHRDTKTGEITGTTVHSEHIGDRNFLILDDICDGGRTFTELAKVLRPLTNGKVYLYVTHAIMSKGLDVFKGLIDHIYTANPFPGVDLTNPIISKIQMPTG